MFTIFFFLNSVSSAVSFFRNFSILLKIVFTLFFFFFVVSFGFLIHIQQVAYQFKYNMIFFGSDIVLYDDGDAAISLHYYILIIIITIVIAPIEFIYGI